ncbi:MAG: hypothetical protein SOI64_07570 [Bifidobacterium mongoliense]|jgi:hypothetical protein|uniref:hypothetical protein n=1 Tax=Bifidobacterium mongoliense TaxID=518643 RepID=UPI002F35731C
MIHVNEKDRPTAMGTARNDYTARKSPNHHESTTGIPQPPTFTGPQLLEAQGMPRTATEPVTAVIMGLFVSYLKTLRDNGMGPAFTTDGDGRIIYHRNDVLAYMHAHNRKGTL